jgi:hypothetical protein
MAVVLNPEQAFALQVRMLWTWAPQHLVTLIKDEFQVSPRVGQLVIALVDQLGVCPLFFPDVLSVSVTVNVKTTASTM